MPQLQKLYFLNCSSGQWQALQGTPNIVSLGLHNLKQGKTYLDHTSFLSTFPRLEYLLTAMLGISSIPQLPELQQLHTVFGVFRNENAITSSYDFSPFRDMKSLRVFNGWMAVDRHRIPADAFLPIIENPVLESFSYTQMYAREDRRAAELIRKYHPSLADTSLTREQLLVTRRTEFAD